MNMKEPKTDSCDGCPVAASLLLLGDRWTLVVVRDLLLGKHKFSEFLASAEAIPTNLLTERLRRLEEHGLVEKHAYQDRPPRYEYHLTESGTALRSVVEAFREWGLRYLPRG